MISKLLGQKDFGQEVLTVLKQEFVHLESPILKPMNRNVSRLLGFQGSAVAAAIIRLLKLNLPRYRTNINIWCSESFDCYDDIEGSWSHQINSLHSQYPRDVGGCIVQGVVDIDGHRVIGINRRSIKDVVDIIDINQEQVGIDNKGQLYFTESFVNYLETGEIRMTKTNRLIPGFIQLLDYARDGVVTDSELARVAELVRFDEELTRSSLKSCNDDNEVIYETVITNNERELRSSLLSDKRLSNLSLQAKPFPVRGTDGYRLTSTSRSNFMSKLSEEATKVLMESYNFNDFCPGWSSRKFLVKMANTIPQNLDYLIENYPSIEGYYNKQMLMKYLATFPCSTDISVLKEYIDVILSEDERIALDQFTSTEEMIRIVNNSKLFNDPSNSDKRYIFLKIGHPNQGPKLLNTALFSLLKTEESVFQETLEKEVSNIMDSNISIRTF